MEFSKISTYVLTDPHDYPSWSGKVQAIVLFKYHFIREAIVDGIIKLQYIPTAEQLADLLTKILPAPQTVKLRDAIAGLRKLTR